MSTYFVGTKFTQRVDAALFLFVALKAILAA
jgi:hypothetical protein